MSILVGVNDVSQGRGEPVDLKKWEEDYRYILNQKPSGQSKIKNSFDGSICSENDSVGLQMLNGIIGGEK